MEKRIITAEMIAEANDYVPLADKEAWASEHAQKCFDRLSITSEGEAMPPMYMVNVGLKNRYLMAALVGMYLKLPYTSAIKDGALMSEDDYDAWAGSHVFCQIDRLKAVKEARDKCYDLLYDYHELEKMFATQINGLLNVQNDYVVRQSQYTASQVNALPLLLEQLKELQEAHGNVEQTAQE